MSFMFLGTIQVQCNSFMFIYSFCSSKQVSYSDLSNHSFYVYLLFYDAKFYIYIK